MTPLPTVLVPFVSVARSVDDAAHTVREGEPVPASCDDAEDGFSAEDACSHVVVGNVDASGVSLGTALFSNSRDSGDGGAQGEKGLSGPVLPARASTRVVATLSLQHPSLLGDIARALASCPSELLRLLKGAHATLAQRSRRVHPRAERGRDMERVDVVLNFVVKPEAALKLAEEMGADIKWARRVTKVLCDHVRADETKAWLSTLGGAHSSMGEDSPAHAEMAGRLAVAQLRVAIDSDDAPLAGQCLVFVAYSLLQRGMPQQARKVLGLARAVARALTPRNERLDRMCEAARIRLDRDSNSTPRS